MVWFAIHLRPSVFICGSLPMSQLKFKLTIAYDGTHYAGWQVQKSGVGVQQRVEEALAKLFPGVGRIHSSSRTDTGVHALGMVAHVEIQKSVFRMPATKLALAINAHLPEDIRVMSAGRCAANFHARFDAVGKQYRYFIWNHVAMNPLLRHQAWQVPRTLDLPAMRSAAKLFLGKHDFKSFAGTRNYEMESTVRRLSRCEIRRNGPLLTFIIEGDGFLYKMCRGIVGTLAQVGQGKIAADEIKGILAGKDRRLAGMTAPACGLVLWKVFYKGKHRTSNTQLQTSNAESRKSKVGGAD
jgi:tRNA pseudouridine38-40 synthase